MRKLILFFSVVVALSLSGATSTKVGGSGTTKVGGSGKTQVTAVSSGLSLPLDDDFARADETPLGTPYVVTFGSINLTSGSLVLASGSEGTARANPTIYTFSSGQVCQVKPTTETIAECEKINPQIQMQADGSSYVTAFNSDGSVRVYRGDWNGSGYTYTQLGSDGSWSYGGGFIGMRISGANITCYVGDITGSFSDIITVTDPGTDLSGGTAGLRITTGGSITAIYANDYP